MNVELLSKLTEAHGVSGQEGAIRAIVREELAGICDTRVDAMGNLIATKAATIKPSNGQPKKLMLAGHMDEIGFIVRYVDDKGFLKLQPIGGHDPRQLPSQRVIVHTREGQLNGLLMMSAKPKHLQKGAAASAPSVDELFVDVGLNGEEAKKAVRLGDMVTMNRQFQTMGDLFTCKAMDDRVAVFAIVEALKAVKDHAVDIVAAMTTQEEVGIRGAAASGWSVQPDIAVALDVTLANDFPGIADDQAITKLGEGTAIKLMDSSLICHPKLVEHFRSLAESNGIKHQIEILPGGGTDAGAFQRLHGGIPSFTLSVPTRYVHTVNETVHKDDVQATIDLLVRYIEDAHNGVYEFE